MARKRKPRVRTTPPNGNGAPRAPLIPSVPPLAPGMFPGAPMALGAAIALAGAVLCLLVAVSYFPALSGGFVWDDVVLTKATPLHAWSGLAQIWFTPRALLPYEGHYWPLLHTTFWLEHKLWGLAPFGYHLVNLLLHTGVVLLLWRLLLRLEVPGAWFAAAVFAVHPLHVESVAWVIGRKDMLATLCYLAAVLAYIRCAEMPRGRRRGGQYLLAVALFVLGLLSKSIAITLPAALLLWHWWRHGRVTLADGSRTLPFFLIGLGIALADYAYYTGLESVAFAYTPLERGLLAAHALAFYVGKLLWPTGLIGVYPRWEPGIGDALAWGGAVGFAAVVAVLWHWRRSLGRGPLAGVLFFAVALSPVLGFVDFGYMQFSFVADRYQYLAGIGLIAVVAGAAGRACQRGLGMLPAHRTRPARLAIGAAGATILAVAGLLTWNQAGLYHDDGTFFTHVIAHNPQAHDAHYNLGVYLQAEGRYAEAQAAYQAALERQPDDPDLLNNIGALLLNQDRYAEAVARFRAVLRLNPQRQDTMKNLAVALDSLGAQLSNQGRHEEAITRYREALRLNPQHQDAMNNFATVLSNIGVQRLNQGRHEEAMARFREALRLHPQHRDAMGNIARVLIDQGRYAAALASMQQVIAHYPDDVQAHHLLGGLLSKQGRPEEAIAHFHEVLRLNPQHPTALRDIAGMRMNQGRYAEGLASAQQAIARDPDDAQAHQLAGLGLFHLDRKADALRHYDRALALDPNLTLAREQRKQFFASTTNEGRQ